MAFVKHRLGPGRTTGVWPDVSMDREHGDLEGGPCNSSTMWVHTSEVDGEVLP